MSAGQNCRWPVRSILTEEEYNFGCDPINESLSEQAVMLPFEFEEFKGGCPPYIKVVALIVSIYLSFIIYLSIYRLSMLRQQEAVL